MCHLVVGLGEVVEGGDVFQEDTKLCWQLFEHQTVVVSVLQLPYVFLETNKPRHLQIWRTSSLTATWMREDNNYLLLTLSLIFLHGN